MSSNPGPWDNVDEPRFPGTEVLRRVGYEHEIDFYHGRLHGGRYFLRLRVYGDVPTPSPIPQLRNVDVVFSPAAHGSELTITLVRPDSAGVFDAFCADLVASARFLKRQESPEALKIVVARIHRWQRLFEGQRSGALSHNEQLGLFGELTFLRDVFLAEVEPFAALSAWQGPSGAEQDFQYQGWLFEVKSQMATSDKSIQISSEHQLDLVSGSIALVHQVFSTTQHSRALTLSALVEELRVRILEASPLAADLFDARMLQAGYEPRAEYDAERLLLSRRSLYEIRDDFPRLYASALPPGLTDVRYRVSLETCAPFQVEIDELSSRAFHGCP